MAPHYQLPEGGVNSTSLPVLGRFLAHNRHSRVLRAFDAADLHSGRRHLVEPTLKQSALLAGVNCTYAFWATRRQAERPEIVAGSIPLIPPAAVPKSNGRSQLELFEIIDDAELVSLARRIRAQRMLEAAVAAENGHGR